MQDYACEADACAEVDRWFGEHHRYLPEEIPVMKKNRRAEGKKGRPKIGEEIKEIFFISCKLTFEETEIQRERERLGRFILSTNDCEIDADTLLQWYKEQGCR